MSYFNKPFEICSYDVDVNHRVKISKLFGFFQEVAWLNAQELKFGFFDLLNHHDAFWALSRLRMKILKYPRWNDVVTFKTWPVSSNRLFARRDLEFYLNNELCGYGTSDWIIASNKGRHLLEPNKVLDNLAFQYQEGIANIETQRLKPKVIEAYQKSNRQVRYNDLDMNQHLNSIRYLDWVLDCLPSDWLKKNQLVDLSINYMHEVPEDAEVEIKYVQLQNHPVIYQFIGVISDSGQNSFIMNIEFESVD